jgi:Cdc6-like AAA superfamily ATPase
VILFCQEKKKNTSHFAYADIACFPCPGQFRNPMTFSAYSESDITDILHHRVGSNIFEDNALKMIARKCMAERGDARFALDMASTIAKNCLDKIAEDDESLSKGFLIKMKDFVATNRAQSIDLTDRIRGLPQACKLCLIALNVLGQNQVSTTSVKALRSFVVQCTISEDDMLTVNDFKNCLETLRDSGLLLLRMKKSSSAYLAQNLIEATVELGYQLEDVRAALAKVCTGEYYEEVAKLAERNKKYLMEI